MWIIVGILLGAALLFVCFMNFIFAEKENDKEEEKEDKKEDDKEDN